MLFSVIIPCYNCVKTLETTVESIRASGLPDYEIVLVDDGSADGTAKLCDTLCARYTEIRCVHQPNAGVSAARNRGIDEAEGEYIWFVDADDTVDSGTLAAVAAIITAQRPDMLLFGMCFDYYHHGRLYRSEELVPPFEGTWTLDQLKERFQELYNCNALTTACNKFIRRDILMQSGVRFHEDMILMEDFLFVLELLPHCQNIYSLPEAIYRYRQAEDEKGAYRRLQRIPDLAGYMQPFEVGLDTLGLSVQEAENLYEMLLWQKLYYAPLRQIRRILMEQKQSKYASLEMGSPLGIYLRNRKTQLRHRIAVAVKSNCLYQKNIRRGQCDDQTPDIY